MMIILIIRRRNKKQKKKEIERILKYKDLTIRIRCMWNVNGQVILVTAGPTGSTSKCEWTDDTSNSRADWKHLKM